MNSLNSLQYPFRHYTSKIGSFLLQRHQTTSLSLYIIIVIIIEFLVTLRQTTRNVMRRIKNKLSNCPGWGSRHLSIRLVSFRWMSRTTVRCLRYVPCCTDPVELTVRQWPHQHSEYYWNQMGQCIAIAQLFPLCGAGWRTVPVPRPVTSGERVKCSVCSQQCPPASHVGAEWPSLPASLPEDWAFSMRQWHQPSRGTCSMPNHWFIRTQLAGRHGAFCHMPWGSPAICTHSLLLYAQLSLALYGLCVCVAWVLYSTSTGMQSVPFFFFLQSRHLYAIKTHQQ